MKTVVNYDHSKKTWIAQNGETYADKDKRKVLLYALKHDHPELWSITHGIACACSQDGNGKGIDLKLIDRLIKACQLIAKGRVFDGFVLSQNGEGKAYRTERKTLTSWTCECEDFQGNFTTVPYGKVCKHTLAQLIAYLAGLDLKPYNPRKPQFESTADFLQGMDDRQAHRLNDPAYQKALLEGGESLFWYFYQEILGEYAPKLYDNALGILKIGDCNGRENEILREEIKSWTCSVYQFERIFETPELNGEEYGEFWGYFYEHSRNGNLARLKVELCNAFEQL